MRAALAICLWLLATLPALADDLRLGFLAIEDDPRFDEDRAYAGVALRPQGDPLTGVRLAINDMKILTDARNLTVILDDAKVASEALLTEAERMVADGVRYLIVDLPGEAVERLATGLAGRVANPVPKPCIGSRCVIRSPMPSS
jgi:hypothetical protein